MLTKFLYFYSTFFFFEIKQQFHSIEPSNHRSSYQPSVALTTQLQLSPLKEQYIKWKLNDFGHFYALQWLDGSTVVVAFPQNSKSRRMGKS